MKHQPGAWRSWRGVLRLMGTVALLLGALAGLWLWLILASGWGK